jgi:hypothetical protein
MSSGGGSTAPIVGRQTSPPGRLGDAFTLPSQYVIGRGGSALLL